MTSAIDDPATRLRQGASLKTIDITDEFSISDFDETIQTRRCFSQLTPPAPDHQKLDNPKIASPE